MIKALTKKEIVKQVTKLLKDNRVRIEHCYFYPIDEKGESFKEKVLYFDKDGGHCTKPYGMRLTIDIKKPIKRGKK